MKYSVNGQIAKETNGISLKMWPNKENLNLISKKCKED